MIVCILASNAGMPLDISNVISCRVRFLSLELDYVDVIMCTRRAKLAQTLALCTLLLDIIEQNLALHQLITNN